MNNKDMSRELIVTLLQRQIDELMLMTEGFMDMETYPEAIIQLAKLKNVEIREYLDLLGELPKTIVSVKEENISAITPVSEDMHTEDEQIIHSEEILIEIPDKQIDLEDIKPEITFDKTLQEEEPEVLNILEDHIDEDKEMVVTEEDKKEEDYIAEVITEDVKEDEKDDSEKKVVDEDDDLEEGNEDEDDEDDDDQEEEEEEEEEEIIILEDEKPETASEIVVEEAPKTTLGERLAASTMTRNEMHSRAENSILSNISNTKITDIRQAISIGDRFRFQRELFRGNGEDMNKTLNYINQLATLQEVESFLQSKYNWSADNAAVEDFFQIIKRKF